MLYTRRTRREVVRHAVWSKLYEELLNGVLQGVDLSLKLAALVGGDGAGDDGARHAAGTAQRLLRGHEHVGDVLVLSQQRQMQQDFKGLSVRGHDNELGNATVQGLGSLVSALLQLLVVGGLLDDIQDGVRQLGVRQGVRFGVDRLGAHPERNTRPFISVYASHSFYLALGTLVQTARYVRW
eukprot:1907-Pyramimonas_sp.AAC.1